MGIFSNSKSKEEKKALKADKAAKADLQRKMNTLNQAFREGRISMSDLTKANMALTQEYALAKAGVITPQQQTIPVAQRRSSQPTTNAALHSSDREVRRSAVEKLTDQAMLENIAKNDNDFRVYEQAIQKVSNQRVLADIAISSNDSNKGYCASLAITKQELLADVVKRSKCEEALIEVVKKLEDKALLAETAKNSEYFRVRAEAVMKLDDQALLSYIAENDIDDYPRREAIKKVADQDVLFRIAVSNNDDSTRNAATGRLTDQNRLAEIAKNDAYYGVRLTAVRNENMQDQTILEYIVKNDIKGQVRMAAADKLADATIAQMGYDYAAQHDDEWIIRQKAVEKVTNQDVIADILKNETNSSVRVIAIGQLADKNLAINLYTEMANNNKEVEAYAKSMLSKLGSVPSFASTSDLLKTVDNMMTREEGINILLTYLDKIDSWDRKDKGYYFYLLARNSRNLGYKKASYAYYAADIANRPVSTTFGWSVLKDEGVLPSSTVPSPEIALDLHKRLPIPRTLDEIKSYSTVSMWSENA